MSNHIKTETVELSTSNSTLSWRHFGWTVDKNGARFNTKLSVVIYTKSETYSDNLFSPDKLKNCP